MIIEHENLDTENKILILKKPLFVIDWMAPKQCNH
jgi:hypothetical protein